jgi:hypothetical protein
MQAVAANNPRKTDETVVKKLLALHWECADALDISMSGAVFQTVFYFLEAELSHFHFASTIRNDALNYNVCNVGHPDDDFLDYLFSSTQIKEQYLLATNQLPATDANGEDMYSEDINAKAFDVMEWFDKFMNDAARATAA